MEWWAVVDQAGLVLHWGSLTRVAFGSDPAELLAEFLEKGQRRQIANVRAIHEPSRVELTA